MYRDTKDIITTCVSCQLHAPQIHMPSHELIPVTSAWPFYKWAIDLVNGQVEVTNRDIVAGIMARLDTERKGWADELPQVLWAFRTTPKGSNRETPFSLVYRSEAIIPAEIAVPTQRVMEFNDVSNVINLKENLELLEERRDIAAIREASNKQKIAKYYNQHVRERTFRPCNYVWRNNNASRVEDTGKLGPNWEGPYVVVEALGNGAYNLKTHDGKFVPR
ncbi:uncharacterized protein [Rutidosis leptorrhynchoides]|uniref:uncharacterized protein n=1 Tax=Rutidosis leptorrhynchoides TaxID=125765 RepID=UPI003A993AE9